MPSCHRLLDCRNRISSCTHIDGNTAEKESAKLYMSQLPSENGGDIPVVSGQWDRLQDGNGAYPWAWTPSSALKASMVQN